MTRVELAGRSGLKVAVSPEDLDLLKSFRWYALRQGPVTYARRVVRKDGKRLTVYLHREIGARIFGKAGIDGKSVDHVNGDGLDCRRTNLRSIPQIVNCWLQFKRPHGQSSGYKGVVWHVLHGAWQAGVHHGRVRKHLGYFADERTAAQTYDLAVLRLHGTLSRLNFPELLAAYVAEREGRVEEAGNRGLLEAAAVAHRKVFVSLNAAATDGWGGELGANCGGPLAVSDGGGARARS